MPQLRRDFAAPRRPWLWVFLGAVGILIVAFGAIVDGHGLLERMGHWWRLGFTVPGHLLLLAAWWQLGPLWRAPMVTAAVWALPMLAVPPLHSRDAYSYAAQGWLLRQGLDPYLVPSGEAGDAGLLVGVHWFHTTSVYPPLSLELFRFISWLFDGDLYWTAIGMRLPNVVALVVLAWALKKLAGHVGITASIVLWAGVLNPVVMVQWVGGVHNDAVMVAALAVAFLVSFNRRWRGWAGMLAGGAGIGVAMSVKQSAAVAGVGMVALAWAASQQRLGEQGRTWFALARRAAAAGACAVGAFAGISLLTGLGMGWNNDTAGNPLMATSNAPVSWLASFIRFRELAPDETTLTVLTTLSTLLVLVGVVWLVVRFGPRPGDHVGQPWALIVGVLTAFAVLGPALQPWYLTWAFAFVALCRAPLRWAHGFVVATWVTSVIAALQDTWPPYVAMGVLILPGYLVWRWLDHNRIPVMQPTTQV